MIHEEILTMNIARVKRDLEVILPDYQRRRRAHGKPTWTRHTWRTFSDGSFEIRLDDFPLPLNARPMKTHVKVEGRKCLYDPAGDGRYYFYRNVWFGHPIEVRIPYSERWGKLPRLYANDEAGWYYLCVHAGMVDGNENIVTFFRILELFVRNADPRIW